MAKSKRPQGNLDIPEPQIQTGISAADTFVDPGVAGMPAPPPGEAPPVQPDDQKARDLLALSESLGNLSTSLRQWGSAKSRGEGIIQDFGEEQAILKRQMDSMGESFTSAVSEGTLEALEHPAAQRGIARGLAKLTARDYAVMMEAKKDEIRNSPEAVDINSMMGAWDQAAMGMAMPKTSRPDVYEREYIKALSPYRSKFEIEHREWLGAKAMSDAEESLKFDIGNVLDASSLMQSQPIVSQNAAGIPVFNPMTDEEIYDLNVTGGAKKVTELLDEEFGSILGAARSKEVVGEHLLNLAMNADNPLTSKMAIDILKNTQVGPPNNRTSLLETPSIKNQYDLVKDRIAAKQQVQRTDQQNDSFKADINQHKEDQIDFVAQVIADGAGTLTREEVKQAIIGGLPDGKTLPVDVNGDGTVDFTVRRDGDKVTRDNGQGASVTYDVEKDVIDAGYTRVYEQSYEQELKDNGGNVGAAHASASIKTNQVSKFLTQSGEIAYRNLDHTRIHGTDEERAELGKAQFETVLHGYHRLVETNNHAMIKDTFPDEDVRTTLSIAHTLYTDPTLRDLGGTTIDRLYERLVSQDAQQGMTIRGFEQKWEEGNGEALVGDLVNQYKWGNGKQVQEDVRRAARALTYFGGLSVEDAIDKAIELKTDEMVEFRGFMLERDSVNADLLNGTILVDSVTGEIPEIWVDKDFGSLEAVFGEGVADVARTVKQNILHFPEWFDSAFLPVWENLLDTNTPGLFHFTKREKQDVVGVVLDVWKGIQNSKKEGLRAITVDEMLDAAEETLRVEPPKDFMNNEFKADTEEILGFIPSPGSNNLAFTLIFETQLGTWRSGGTYGMDDVIKLGRWGDETARAEAFYTVQQRRERAAEAKQKEAEKSFEKGIIQGEFTPGFKSGPSGRGFRHPLDILWGSTYGQRDYSGETVRRQQVPEKIRERGLRTGTIYSTPWSPIEQ